MSIIGWVAEVSVTTALEHQARGRVEIEVASLMADYQRLSLAGLQASIEARSPANKHLEYAIAGSDGAIIFGDHSLSKFVARPNEGTSLITRYGGGLASDTILVARQGLGSEMQLLVADDLQSVDDVEDVVLNAFLVALAMAAVFGIGVGTFFTRFLLRRLDGVTRTAQAIIAGDLAQRIPLTGSGDDFDHLSATLNSMLDRISDLLESLRQVSNDIAHDLRMPLARLRQRLEDSRLHAASPTEFKGRMRSARSTLFLARLRPF
jgi:methyl-accepting chemotaxis protein